MYKKDDELYIELVGGVGNQLFIFFAGLYYSRLYDKKLILDFTEISKGLTNHGSSIKSFRLVSPISIHKNSTSMSKNLNKKILDKLSIKVKGFNTVRYLFTGTYQAKEIGFDELLQKHFKIKRLQGYYQTFKYIDMLEKSGSSTDLTLVRPSELFKKLAKEIVSQNPVVVHVRRGDYENPKSLMGLLSAKYYESALNLVNRLHSTENYWVFSDDIFEAKKLLSPMLPNNTNWIMPKSLTDPAESLVLMSLAKKLIIANSSFSWWAARSGSIKEVVIAPNPWFKSIRAPNELIPNSWISLDSDFI